MIDRKRKTTCSESAESYRVPSQARSVVYICIGLLGNLNLLKLLIGVLVGIYLVVCNATVVRSRSSTW